MMDSLSVKGMKFHGLHGVQEQEKIDGNDFEVDVVFWADLSTAGTSDNLKDAINYTKVQEITASVMLGESVDLIERLCFDIGNKLADHFDEAEKLEVCVRKLNPPIKAPVACTEARMSWPR
jgi:dihydroneopterin aldolase